MAAREYAWYETGVDEDCRAPVWLEVRDGVVLGFENRENAAPMTHQGVQKVYNLGGLADLRELARQKYLGLRYQR